MIYRSIASILILTFIACLSASAKEIEHYIATATIIEDGAVLGTPTLRIISGQQAAVTISGARPYQLTLTLSPATDDTVLATSVITTSNSNTSPSFMAELGKETSIRSDNIEFRLTVDKFTAEEKVAGN